MKRQRGLFEDTRKSPYASLPHPQLSQTLKTDLTPRSPRFSANVVYPLLTFSASQTLCLALNAVLQ